MSTVGSDGIDVGIGKGEPIVPVGAGSEYPTVTIPTPAGKFQVRIVEVHGTAVLVATTFELPVEPVVRFHSSCVFGESLHAVDCDCGAQLDAALRLIGREGGILVYTWEEGRGVGIVDKIRAIHLQETKLVSTVDAFGILGHKPEPRTFELQIRALKSVFDGRRIRFASGNPQKIAALEDAGFEVVRAQLEVEMTPEREAYLAHKRQHLGHLHDN